MSRAQPRADEALAHLHAVRADDVPDPVDRAVNGDASALELLWQEHRAWLASVLLCHAPRGADIDDLLQEVALRLCREIHRLAEPGAFRGWLRVIAINVARSVGRSFAAERRREAQTDAATLPDPRTDGAATDPIHERLERTLDVIESFPPSYREPLLLKSVHGWSQRRIATTLGIPVTAVESRLARARRMLRVELRSATRTHG